LEDHSGGDVSSRELVGDTTSLDALKAYSKARVVHFSMDYVAAKQLYERALEIDPKFVMAHVGLGQLYGESGESDRSSESMRQAYSLRDRASDLEKFHVSAAYDFRVTGNLERAQQTCVAWAQTYPRDTGPHNFLATFYRVMGNFEKSAEESQQTIDLDPQSVFGYSNLASNYRTLDRLGEATKVLKRAADRNLEELFSLCERYDHAFLNASTAGMERELGLSQGKVGLEDFMIGKQAFALAYSGHLQLSPPICRSFGRCWL
jgi:tetratricopeptide (TPR) repeat protein